MNPFSKTVETSKGPITIRPATGREVVRMQEAKDVDEVNRIVGEIVGAKFDFNELLFPEINAIAKEVKDLTLGTAALEKNSSTGGAQWAIVPAPITAKPSAETSETATAATTESLTLTPKT